MCELVCLFILVVKIKAKVNLMVTLVMFRCAEKDKNATLGFPGVTLIQNTRLQQKVTFNSH